MNTIAIILGSIMLGLGIMSPSLGSVNAYAVELVFFGIALIIVTVMRDDCKDRKEKWIR